jgi:hypothetical protein
MWYGQHLLHMCSLAAQRCWPSQFMPLMQHSSSEAGRCSVQHISVFSCKQRNDQYPLKIVLRNSDQLKNAAKWYRYEMLSVALTVHLMQAAAGND